MSILQDLVIQTVDAADKLGRGHIVPQRLRAEYEQIKKAVAQSESQAQQPGPLKTFTAPNCKNTVFSKTDVVCLIGGGPGMTVVAISPDRKSVRTQWFNDGLLQEWVFDVDTIEHLTDDDDTVLEVTEDYMEEDDDE